jgi:hypothetical protein
MTAVRCLEKAVFHDFLVGLTARVVASVSLDLFVHGIFVLW